MLQRYKIFLNGCNITTFFNTIHSFFCRKITKNTLKTTFYLNVTKTKTLLEDCLSVSVYKLRKGRNYEEVTLSTTKEEGVSK